MLPPSELGPQNVVLRAHAHLPPDRRDLVLDAAPEHESVTAADVGLREEKSVRGVRVSVSVRVKVCGRRRVFELVLVLTSSHNLSSCEEESVGCEWQLVLE